MPSRLTVDHCEKSRTGHRDKNFGSTDDTRNLLNYWNLSCTSADGALKYQIASWVSHRSVSANLFHRGLAILSSRMGIRVRVQAARCGHVIRRSAQTLGGRL